MSGAEPESVPDARFSAALDLAGHLIDNGYGCRATGGGRIIIPLPEVDDDEYADMFSEEIAALIDAHTRWAYEMHYEHLFGRDYEMIVELSHDPTGSRR